MNKNFMSQQQSKQEQNELQSIVGGAQSFVDDETFCIPASVETLGRISRGKVSRPAGCSMIDWSNLLRKQSQKAVHERKDSILSLWSSNPTGNSSSAKLPQLTIAEVMRHNSPDDLWLVMRGVAYDCTKFQHFHPGGEHILQKCAGRDCTALYDHCHKWVCCESILAPFAVGVVQNQ